MTFQKIAFDRNSNPMWIYDIDTLDILEVNEAAQKKYDIPRQKFLKMNLLDFRPKSYEPVLNDVFNKLKNKESVREEILRFNDDGKKVWVELEVLPISDNQAKQSHWVAVERNINLRKRSEAFAQVKNNVLQLMASDVPLSRIFDCLQDLLEDQLEDIFTALYLIRRIATGWSWRLSLKNYGILSSRFPPIKLVKTLPW